VAAAAHFSIGTMAAAAQTAAYAHQKLRRIAVAWRSMRKRRHRWRRRSYRRSWRTQNGGKRQ